MSDKEMKKNLFGMDSTLLRDITERNPGLKLRNIVSFPASFVPISTKYIFASVNKSSSLEVGERWRENGQLNKNYYYANFLAQNKFFE